MNRGHRRSDLFPGDADRLEDANVAVDSGSAGDDLSQHYNRPLDGDIGTAKTAYSNNLQNKQAVFDLQIETPSKSRCDNALKALGQMTHAWEDYYAHAIGLTSPFRGDPGPIEGDPNNLSTNLKPCSWGSLTDWGEHGATEPAWREPDQGLDRATQAVNFVMGEIESRMTLWSIKCHCFYGY